MLEAVAVSRIQRFEKTIQVTAARENRTIDEVRRKNKFDNRLDKFKRIESGAPTETAQTKALKAKLAAFEVASKQDPVAFKTTWKNVDAGTWREHTVRAPGHKGAPPQKKSLADLP